MSSAVRKWLLPIGCAWINFFLYSVFRSAGVLFVAIERTFECSREEASWPMTLASGVAAITCLVSGFLSHYMQKWIIAVLGILVTSLGVVMCYFGHTLTIVSISLGVVQGIGIGIATVQIPVIISEQFSDQKAAAIGLSYAGGTLGSLVFPLLIERLLSKFELPRTMLIIGSLQLCALLAVPFLWPKKRQDYLQVNGQDEGQEVDDLGKTEISYQVADSTVPNVDDKLEISPPGNSFIGHLANDIKLLANPYFGLISLTYICFITINVTLLIILPDFALDFNVHKDKAVLLLSVFGISDFFGRLIPGWLSYAKIISNRMIFVWSILSIGIIVLLYPIFMRQADKSEYLYHIIAGLTVIYGFMAGCQMILAPVVMAEYLGQANMSVSFGMCNFLYGIFSFGRPFLIGYIKDRTEKYDQLFYILGGFAIFVGLCWFAEIFIVHLRKYKQSRPLKNRIELHT
ncbi:Monocarboxylate transporter 12 [Halotydeus destructor]|nr:Monocarboxylate transporter 12 [Halotydeus destructor]